MPQHTRRVQHVNRGPGWLFVRLDSAADTGDGPQLSDELWDVADRHFTYRVVLEMDDVAILNSWFIGQLISLGRRLHQRQGKLRLCGLSDGCRQALAATRLENHLISFDSREEAVLGGRRLHVHFCR